MQKFILASSSPRRKTILQMAHLNFDIIPGETDESFPENLRIEQVPIHVAREKGQAARKKEVFSMYEPSIPVLAADTIVVLDDEIIGKPANRDEAITILKKLSDRTHKVITGVVISTDTREIAFHDITEVTFHHLPESSIELYVEQYKPYDKAGAYAIQEWIGVVGIKSINGDYYNVMGLPVSRVVSALHEHF